MLSLNFVIYIWKEMLNSSGDTKTEVDSIWIMLWKLFKIQGEQHLPENPWYSGIVMARENDFLL